MKFLRWFLGLVLIGALIALNIVIDMPLLCRLINPLLLCCFICLFRIARGPEPADRIVALDIVGILVIGFCGVIALITKQGYFIDIGIAWALQAFIATVAFSKFLEGKGFDE